MEGEPIKYLMLDHGGVLDGDATRDPPTDKDLLIGVIQPGLYQILRNGVQIVKDLNTLVNEYNYGIVFHSKNKEDKQVKLLQDVRKACAKLNLTFPKVLAMAVRDAKEYKGITPENAVYRRSSYEDIPIFGYDKETDGKTCVRTAISKHLNISKAQRRLHYAFDDGPLVISKAKEEGWSAYLIGNSEDGKPLDVAIAQILKRESTRMIEVFGDFIEGAQREEKKSSFDNAEGVNNINETPRWEQSVGPSADTYSRTQESKRIGRNYFSCGTVENLRTKAKLIAKSNFIGDSDSLPYALKQRIAADIYSFFDVKTPRIEISKQQPINSSFLILENEKTSASMHILTEIIPDFQTYKKACGSRFSLTKAQFNEGVQLKTGEKMPERGLGVILAIAVFINDKNVIGAHGSNIGFVKKQEKGEVYAQSVKIDPYEPFEFEEEVEKTFTISYSPITGEAETIDYDELPERTKKEFISTLQKIAATDKEVLQNIFERDGAEEFTVYADFQIESLLSRREEILTIFKSELDRLGKH